MKICSIDDCRDAARTRGMCSFHYERKLKGRDMLAPRQVKHSSLNRDENGNKECKDCRLWLPESLFGPNSKSSDRLNPWCKECRAWRSRLKRYGMSRSGFAKLLDSQGGVCPICKTDTPSGIGWVIDHDHSCCPTPPSGGNTCGKCVRGILCQGCNTAIGMLEDSVERLDNAKVYLAIKNG